jgi:hypothetical protein
MRTHLKLVFAVVLAAATMFGGSALAKGRPNGGTQAAQVCGTGSVSTDAPMRIWPPNGKKHTYTFTYTGGSENDTFSTVTSSSDNKGVVTADSGSPATVDAAGDPVSTQSTLRAGRPGHPKNGRTYTVEYTVSGSNSCTGSFTIVVPHDRRKSNR